jgi:Mrp family chromosome partitioning ATPase
MRHRFLVEPNSLSAEPFRTLRLAIEARMGTRTGPAVMFSSPRPRDGRSTVAANYAVVSAFGGRHVLLLDGDMRKPDLHEIFGVPRSPGLVDVLRDRLDPWRVTHAFPALGGLHVMTAGSQLAFSGDLAASPALGELLQSLYEHYEALVLDSPPALIAADASGLASHPGIAVVMVVNRAGKRQHVVRALRKLSLTEANVLGLVVNREGTLTADMF